MLRGGIHEQDQRVITKYYVRVETCQKWTPKMAKGRPRIMLICFFQILIAIPYRTSSFRLSEGKGRKCKSTKCLAKANFLFIMQDTVFLSFCEHGSSSVAVDKKFVTYFERRYFGKQIYSTLWKWHLIKIMYAFYNAVFQLKPGSPRITYRKREHR